MDYNKKFFNLYYRWWKNIDKFIFFLIVLLFSTGLFFSLVSTSLLVSDKLETNDYAFFFKHLFFAFLGIVFWFIVRGIWRIVCVLLNIILIPCSIFNNIIRVKFWRLNKREINFNIFKKSIF